MAFKNYFGKHIVQIAMSNLMEILKCFHYIGILTLKYNYHSNIGEKKTIVNTSIYVALLEKVMTDNVT